MLRKYLKGFFILVLAAIMLAGAVACSKNNGNTRNNNNDISRSGADIGYGEPAAVTHMKEVKTYLPKKFHDQNDPFVISVYNVKTNDAYNVKFERYVQNVLAGNHSDGLPKEYLKAEAVVLRTRILSHIENNRSNIAGVDVSTDSFGGYEPSLTTPKIISACEETRGMVLTYNGQLAARNFDLSAAADGGMAAGNTAPDSNSNSKNNFFKKLNPFKAVSFRNAGDTWTVKLTKEEFGEYLKDYNIHKMTLGNMHISKKNMNGDVRQVVIGTVRISYDEFVSALREALPNDQITKLYARERYVVIHGTNENNEARMGERGGRGTAIDMANSGKTYTEILDAYTR